MSYDKFDTLRDSTGKPIECVKCQSEIDVYNCCANHINDRKCDTCCDCVKS